MSSPPFDIAAWPETPFDVGEAMRANVDQQRKAARERGERIGPEYEPVPDDVRCDATSMGGTFRCIDYRGHEAEGTGHHYQEVHR